MPTPSEASKPSKCRKLTVSPPPTSDLPLLIAVSGKLGSGKDYVIEHFILPWVTGSVSRMAFADQIKITVASRDDSISLRQCLEGKKSLELRRKLQIVGTEEGRDLYGPNVWVNTLENWIRLRKIRGDKLDVVLITDCRFENEAQWIEQHSGLLIRVNAPQRNKQALEQEANGSQEAYNAIANHSSETALDSYPFKYVIDNDVEYESSSEDCTRVCLSDYVSHNLDKSAQLDQRLLMRGFTIPSSATF
jgi:hypothetical protein